MDMAIRKALDHRGKEVMVGRAFGPTQTTDVPSSIPICNPRANSRGAVFRWGRRDASSINSLAHTIALMLSRKWACSDKEEEVNSLTLS